MKRIGALCLCLLALAGVFAVGASAEDTAQTAVDDRLETVIDQAKSSYRRSLYAAGKSSFHGYCGLMTSHQLRALGINTWCIINDGNRQFDYYKDLEVTDGGYYITPYSAYDYSLEGALNTITRYGTRDAYNILVGFQWTSTEAGSRYGHAVLINGIVDGTVYFVESFDCSLDRYHPEGSVISCSISRFADYFGKWTKFDGIIHFGTGQYSDGCAEYGTDVTVQARFDSQLRSQPCLPEQNGCTLLRSVSAGERLRATGILENKQGDCYYRIEEDGRVGYIAAGAVCAQRADPEDLELVDAQFPDVVRGEQDGLSGTVIARHGGVAAVEAVVTDSVGKQVRSVRCGANGYRWELDSLNEQLSLHTLEPGYYTVELYAQCAQPALFGQELQTLTGRVRLQGQVVQVGGLIHNAKAHPALQKKVQQPYEGWVYENDRWYFYEDGAAVTGWLTHCGVQYYLDDTGAAVTGWQQVDGKTRYFSHTGGLVTGWLTQEGVTYALNVNDGTIEKAG